MYPDLALLLLRVAIGGIVIPHGLLKLGLVGKGGSIAGVAGWFNSLGLRPGIFWAYMTTLAEQVVACSRSSGSVVRSVPGCSLPISPW